MPIVNPSPSPAPSTPTATFSRDREQGQVIVLTVLALLVILGMVGLVIDVGSAYYAQRHVQATADAAALAGAVNLPDATTAMAVAAQYGANGKNATANLPNVTESITTRCATSLPGCDPTNLLVVTETAHVSTKFLRIFNINNVDVTVRSTACGPCATRPADIMIIVDRTGSMCMDYQGNNDPACTKLENARSGVLTMLKSLDPAVDRVGLAVLPPATSAGSICSAPPLTSYNSMSASWVPVGLTTNYKLSNGQLNNSSPLVSAVNCLPSAGYTAYADAIDKAQAELNANGRSNAGHYIVFFTDGAANTGPSYYPVNSPYRQQPCHQGVNSANAAKGQGTTIYSIGYTLNAQGGAANVCQAQSPTGPLESPAITAYQAVSQIASNSNTFYNQPTLTSLDGIFASVAAHITGPRLVPDNTP
jgi:Flp pilus assembly protein TadG